MRWENPCMTDQMNQWLNERVNWWVDAMNEPMSQWCNGSKIQWINESTNQRMNKLVSRWVNESMNERMNGWMNGWMSELLLCWATSSLGNLLWAASQLPLMWLLQSNSSLRAAVAMRLATQSAAIALAKSVAASLMLCCAQPCHCVLSQPVANPHSRSDAKSTTIRAPSTVRTFRGTCQISVQFLCEIKL